MTPEGVGGFSDLVLQALDPSDIDFWVVPEACVWVLPGPDQLDRVLSDCVDHPVALLEDCRHWILETWQWLLARVLIEDCYLWILQAWPGSREGGRLLAHESGAP